MNNHKLIFISRNGQSAHYWFGPLGIHIYRGEGKGKFVAFDWCKDWRS